MTKGQDPEGVEPQEDVIETEIETEPTGATDEEGQEPDLGEEHLLARELEEVRAREAEYLDGWQRARAELSNARKRFQREQQNAYGNAQADVLTRLLPVVDDFERAFESLPEGVAGLPWIEGITLVQRKLGLLLEQSGVRPIEAEGLEFDPYAHQAVTHEPSEEVPEGHVIADLQKGYKQAERVLRPSMVRVSSGPLPEAEIEDGAEEIGLSEDE